jgi:hypothetical protein
MPNVAKRKNASRLALCLSSAGSTVVTRNSAMTVATGKKRRRKKEAPAKRVERFKLTVVKYFVVQVRLISAAASFQQREVVVWAQHPWLRLDLHLVTLQPGVGKRTEAGESGLARFPGAGGIQCRSNGHLRGCTRLRFAVHHDRMSAGARKCPRPLRRSSRMYPCDVGDRHRWRRGSGTAFGSGIC